MQAATETMTDNEDFLEHMTKLSNLLKLSNNTMESTISTLQSDIDDLKENNDVLLKKWNSDFESFETEARKRMEKDSRELELEFNIFNKDMTAKFKAYENNLRRNIDQTRDAFTALEKIEQDIVNQKSSMLQQNEKNRQFSSKSISLEEKLEEQRTQLISFKQKLQTNKAELWKFSFFERIRLKNLNLIMLIFFRNFKFHTNYTGSQNFKFCPKMNIL